MTNFVRLNIRAIGNVKFLFLTSGVVQAIQAMAIDASQGATVEPGSGGVPEL